MYLKKLIILAALAAAACSDAKQQTIDARAMAFTEANPDTTAIPDTVDAMAAFNIGLSQVFLEEADRAAQMRDGANGLLLLSAVAWAAGDAAGLASEALNYRWIVTLGLSEGIRYSRPNSAVQAFTLASEQNACIARVTRQFENTTVTKAGRTTQYDSNALVPLAWEATMMSRGALMRNLQRPSFNLVSLVGNLTSSKAQELDLKLSALQSENRALQMRSGLKPEDPRYHFLTCLLHSSITAAG